MKEETCLDRGAKLIAGDRRKDYGPIEQSAKDVAAMWSVILKIEVSPENYLLCMTALKIYRESVAHKQDNLDDIAGYTLLVEQVIKAQQKS